MKGGGKGNIYSRLFGWILFPNGDGQNQLKQLMVMNKNDSLLDQNMEGNRANIMQSSGTPSASSEFIQQLYREISSKDERCVVELGDEM